VEGKYLNLQAENNRTEFNSILTNDMDRQSVNNENPDNFINLLNDQME
jgi:hypothetical protein